MLPEMAKLVASIKAREAKKDELRAEIARLQDELAKLEARPWTRFVDKGGKPRKDLAAIINDLLKKFSPEGIIRLAPRDLMKAIRPKNLKRSDERTFHRDVADAREACARMMQSNPKLLKVTELQMLKKWW
jgi:hypothetical protein